MRLLKISTIALAMALTGWVACGNDNGDGKKDAQQILGTGGTVSPDGPVGTGGSGGSLDAGQVADSALSDVPLSSDVSAIGQDGEKSLDTVGIDTPSSLDGGVNICTGLSAADCHLAIIGATTDLSVSALDPGPNPAVPYPTCSAQ